MDGHSFCFEVFSENNTLVKGCKTDTHGTVVQGNHKSYRFSAASEQERSDWLDCIRGSIREDPFHKIIETKKSALRTKSSKHRPDIPQS